MIHAIVRFFRNLVQPPRPRRPKTLTWAELYRFLRGGDIPAGVDEYAKNRLRAAWELLQRGRWDAAQMDRAMREAWEECGIHDPELAQQLARLQITPYHCSEPVPQPVRDRLLLRGVALTGRTFGEVLDSGEADLEELAEVLAPDSLDPFNPGELDGD